VKVGVTGIVIEEGRILLLEQGAGAGSDAGPAWSLPGGEVGPDESLAEALVRELHDETGADVSVGRLLYVCDDVPGEGPSSTSVFFVATLIGGDVGQAVVDAETHPLRGVRFVEISQLPEYGFSSTFMDLASASFPGAGSYLGARVNIGL
jgi:ADP-ribose pyrophosphatase YjhB (NUDIX family)